MEMDALLGNEHIKENLARSLEKGHISHFYLISGPEGSGKRTLILSPWMTRRKKPSP